MVVEKATGWATCLPPSPFSSQLALYCLLRYLLPHSCLSKSPLADNIAYAVVTGGAGGLGKQLAKHLLFKGYHVVVGVRYVHDHVHSTSEPNRQSSSRGLCQGSIRRKPGLQRVPIEIHMPLTDTTLAWIAPIGALTRARALPRQEVCHWGDAGPTDPIRDQIEVMPHPLAVW